MRNSHWIVVPVATALLVTIAACNEKKDVEEKKVVTEIEEVALPKTKADFEQLLIGKWELDSERFRLAIKSEMEKEEIDPNDPLANNGRAMLERMMSMEMSFDFKADGSIDMITTGMGQEQKESSEWKVSEVKENNAITLIRGDAIIITFLSENEIQINPSVEDVDELPVYMSNLRLNRVK